MLFVAALGACRKQPAECPQFTRAPQAFLDYWYFPEGSSWIYRLREANPVPVYDTLRVSFAREQHITESVDSDNRAPCVQGYLVSLTHSNRTYFPGGNRLGTEFLASDPLFYGEDWVMNQLSSVGTLYSPEVGFGYPIRLGQKLLNRLTFTDTTAVTVPAGTFRQSVHMVPDFGSKVDSTQRNWIRHVYYSRYVGMTKVVYTNNQTWELLKFTIKR